MEPRLRCPDGDLQRDGHICEWETHVEVEDEDRSLSGGQSAQSPLELVTVFQLGGAIGLGRFSANDRDFGPPPPAVAGNVGARMQREPVEPGIEPVDIAQGRQIAPRTHQRVLCGILREVSVAEDQAGDGVQPIDGSASEHRERLAISTSSTLHKLGVHTGSLVERPIRPLYTVRRCSKGWGSFIVRRTVISGDAAGDPCSRLESNEWLRGGLVSR
jgi:hypothetical protein